MGCVYRVDSCKLLLTFCSNNDVGGKFMNFLCECVLYIASTYCTRNMVRNNKHIMLQPLSIKHFRSIGVVPMTVLPLCVSHSDYCVGIDDVPMKKKHNNTHFPINTCFYCYAYLSSLVVNKWTDSFNFNQKLNGEFTFRCSFAWNMCIRFIIDNTFQHFNVFAN